MRFLLLLLLAPQAWAAQATCQLSLVPPGSGFNVLSMTVDPLPADGFDLPPSTDTCDLNGTMDATLDVDLTTDKTSELTLANGVVTADDGDPGADDFVFNGMTGDAILGVEYDLVANGLSSEVFTPTPPGTITNVTNGEFDASQHAFNLITGTLDGNITVSGLAVFPPVVTPINRTVSIQEPIEGTGNGTGTVTLVPTGSSPGFENYTVTLTMPISSTKTYQNAEGTADSFVVSTSALIKATGTLQVPDTPGYTDWATAEGIPGADPDDDYNGDGVTNAFAWAYGLGKDDDASAWRPMAQANGGFQIPLPPGGTVTPIRVRVSTTLSGWSDLPAGRISGGQNPLPSGSSGSFSITPSGGPREFLLLEVDE